MGFATRCHLKIPFPSWARDNQTEPERDFENWKEVQRWADDFYTNCLPDSGGGKIPFFVAASDAPDEIKAVSDYICTGTDDHLVINQAIANSESTDLSTLATNHVTLSFGNFYLGGGLDYVSALEGAGGDGSGGMGTILHTTAAITGTFINSQIVRNLQVFASHNIGTAILLGQGNIANVAIRASSSAPGPPVITTGIKLQNGGANSLSNVTLIDVATGVLMDAGNGAALSSCYVQGCTTGVSVSSGAFLAVAGCTFDRIPSSASGISNAGILAASGCVFKGATSSTGNTAIINTGTVNSDVEAANTFSAVGTTVSGGGGGVPVVESDAEGYRIPIKNAAGAIVGYVGSASPFGTDEVLLWFGDNDDVGDDSTGYAVPNFHASAAGVGFSTGTYTHYLWLPNDGVASAEFASFYLETNGNIGFWATDVGANVYLGAPNGLAELLGGTVKLVSSSATGIDGSATPSTAAELADVLVDLGVIASHTIP